MHRKMTGVNYLIRPSVIHFRWVGSARVLLFWELIYKKEAKPDAVKSIWNEIGRIYVVFVLPTAIQPC